MNLQSNPTNPSARALCGDFAVQQNTSNRSRSLLNDAMDTTFLPEHRTWRGLWVTQQQAESRLAKALADRDAADAALDDAIRSVLRSAQASLGADSPELRQ